MSSITQGIWSVNDHFIRKVSDIRVKWTWFMSSLQGYMMKKGHKRKNWTERWFMLKPNSISYYVAEDLAEKKGDILLDGNCGVEARTCCCYENSLLHREQFDILSWHYFVTRDLDCAAAYCGVLFTFAGLILSFRFLCRLYKIKRERSVSSSSSLHKKALKSARRTRRRSRSGSRVSNDTLFLLLLIRWS